MPTDTATEITPQAPWYNEAEFAEFEDYEFHLSEWDGRLAIRSARHDYRDAIVGWSYRLAPPSQQYGYRLRVWLHRQRVLAEQIDALTDTWPPDGTEPF